MGPSHISGLFESPGAIKLDMKTTAKNHGAYCAVFEAIAFGTSNVPVNQATIG